MLAQRTDKVGRERFPFVRIAADFAAPYCFARCGGLCRLRFNRGLIIGIGGGRSVRQHIHIRYGSDKEGVASEIDRLFHRRADISVCARGDIVQAIGAAFTVGISGKFVNRASRLEAEMPEQCEVGLFAQNRNIEPAAFLYEFMRKIGFVDGDTDPVG